MRGEPIMDVERQIAAMQRADLWSGLFWVVFGATIAVYSTSMPIPTHLGATVLTGPGLVPGLLGGCIALLGALLVLRSLFGLVITDPNETGDPSQSSNGRALTALVLMVIYAASIATRQPFVPCTVAFISLFVTAFNWEGRTSISRTKIVGGAIVLGLITGLSVEFVFEQIFYVRLP
jgi:hypothetical protein